MMTLNFNEGSWHHRLAFFYGPLSKWDTETDICAYTRAVLRGLLAVLALILIGGVIIGIPLGSAIGWAAACLVARTWVTPELEAAFGIMMVLIVAALPPLFYITKVIADWREARWLRLKDVERQPVEPGFIGHAYLAFKEKYCVPVVITKKEQQ